MSAVTVSRCDEQLIAVKQVTAERAEYLEREAELLRRLDHPGLVRFVDLVETADGGRALHTEFVNADTWATRPLSDPAERAAGMAALAAVVADLHQLGVAHLQLTEPHVLHGTDDRPVLCGLTRAEEATTENCQRDLVALAELCHDSSLGKSVLAGKLLAVADAARGGLIGAREMARRLDLLAAKKPAKPKTVKSVTNNDTNNKSAEPGGSRPNQRVRRLIIAAAVGVAIVGGFALGSRSADQDGGTTAVSANDNANNSSRPDNTDNANDSSSPDSADNTDNANDSETANEAVKESEHSETADEAVDETERSSKTVGAVGAIGAVGSAVSVQQAAAVLTHDGHRYALGSVGDFVETGDWDCDGIATAAIVSPESGEIVLFDDWPEPGETLALPQRWSVDSPTGVEAVANGNCDMLRVYTTNGSKLFNPASDEGFSMITQITGR